jgi:hypothetical protein
MPRPQHTNNMPPTHPQHTHTTHTPNNTHTTHTHAHQQHTRAQVDNLVALDLIKARNKPVAPPKKPAAAPFFLPTVATLERNPVFDLEAGRELLGGWQAGALRAGAAAGRRGRRTCCPCWQCGMRLPLHIPTADQLPHLDNRLCRGEAPEEVVAAADGLWQQRGAEHLPAPAARRLRLQGLLELRGPPARAGPLGHRPRAARDAGGPGGGAACCVLADCYRCRSAAGLVCA